MTVIVYYNADKVASGRAFHSRPVREFRTIVGRFNNFVMEKNYVMTAIINRREVISIILYILYVHTHTHKRARVYYTIMCCGALRTAELHNELV